VTDESDYEEILRGIEDSYDKAGENYYQLFHDDICSHPYDQNLLSEFVAQFPYRPKICDMGCGPGAQYGAYVINECESVHGVDISGNNIEIAKKNNPKITFKKSDFAKTDYLNRCFDGIISFYALFHIKKSETKLIFKEFYRLLRPKGRLLLVTHKGTFCDTISDIWGHSGLKLYANFHIEEEIAEPLKMLDSRTSLYAQILRIMTFLKRELLPKQ
jgi:ubiquinone/menaquinone biosynthesis C-methylase UbiE